MPDSFRAWEVSSAVFLAYVGVVGLAGPGRAADGRWRAVRLAAIGLALTLTSWALPPTPIVHDWLLPPALLLIGYWSAGALFVAPMPAAERLLLRVDRTLRISSLSAAMPRSVAECLELAYAGVYALIPIALVIHLTLGHAPSPARFWTVVLVTDYICFGALPWLQTRPPRSLEAGEPWVSRVRAFNRRMVDATSIHVNTCPSGHAAEALAAALLVLDAPPLVVAGMLICALAVSAGAVFGRYHYAVDILTGWLVAILVWLAV